MMRLEEFQELASAYGSDIERWPESLRADATALAETSEKARRVLEQESVLDWHLDDWAVAGASEDLARSVREAARVTPQDGLTAKAPNSPRLGRWLWAQFAGAAVAAIIGFAIGWSGLWSADPSSAEPIDLSPVVFDVDYEETFDDDS